jgi:hypothetical protein
MPLFQGSIFEFQQRAQRAAIDEVNRLPRSLFSDPALGGTLDHIAARYRLNVAVLEREKIHGTRRDIDRQIDTFGGHRKITVQEIDVRIPFRGDDTSFSISPSRSTMIQVQCEIKSDHLLITLPDDQTVQNHVDQFVTVVSANLDTLRSEIDTWIPQLRGILEQVAVQRRATIENEIERDKKLNFPIVR